LRNKDLHVKYSGIRSYVSKSVHRPCPPRETCIL
jgi:hypothetical protein